MAKDIFQKDTAPIKSPITADKCTITIGGTTIADAIQFQATYGQSITHRRAIGNKSVIIYGSMPRGQISIARLIADGSSNLLSSDIFTCTGGTISFKGTSCDGGSTVNYVARGCMASNFSISANADDLTVLDNIVIEFVELSQN